MSTDIERIEKLEKAFIALGKQVAVLAENLETIRAAVSVLRLHAATQLRPDSPLDGVKILQGLEKPFLDEKYAQDLQKLADTAEGLLHWMNKGKPPLD
jgi:hypothetical protein